MPTSGMPHFGELLENGDKWNDFPSPYTGDNEKGRIITMI
ncbi:hypothetical protein AC26_4323 [Escherichia coli 1-176-05_S3_C2]|nr:hypothetical protein AC26_4323 [Escherichia coli 1-176-05_S3_C2]